MKPISEQDHYEILEVPRGANLDRIERAYRIAQVTYADDSLAGYSVLGVASAAAIRERVAVAHRVLTDESSRAAYDASLPEDAELLEPSDDDVQPEQPAVRAPAALDELEALDDGTGDFDGARLRRSRLRRGLELDDLSRITKVNTSYLGFLEEERFEELPERVYVRGFVAAYASCLGLDPMRVASSYMERYQIGARERRRGRRR